MQQGLQIPFTDPNDPQIKVELLFKKEDIDEAISELNKFIGTIRTNIAELKEVISDLGVRKDHYRKLILQGRYKKESMEKSISDMDVEIRRYNDKIDRYNEKRRHFSRSIDALNVKMKEAERFKVDIKTEIVEE